MKNLDKTKSDFQFFNSVNEIKPSVACSEQIKNQIQELLNPSVLTVFLKLAKIVMIVGLLTLAICPQFGIGFIRDSHVFDFFMYFGHKACKFFCGMFFLGVSMFISTFFLKAEDLAVLKANSLLEIALLSVVALSAFVAAGAKVFITVYLIWLLGAIIGGYLALFLASRLLHSINYRYNYL